MKKEEILNLKIFSLNVLFIGRYNTSEILSGPEKVAKRIFNEFTKQDKSVFVEYFFDGKKYKLFKKLFGSETVINRENSLVLRLGIIKLFLYLLKTKPSYIHIITYERFALICFIYKIFFDVNILYNIHGITAFENKNSQKTSTFYKLKDNFCEKIFLNYSDNLIFLSEKSISICKKYYHLDDNKIQIIPNGVDTIFYSSGKQKLVNRNDILKIVFIGDVNQKEKGFDFLNDSLDQLSIPYKLYILCYSKNSNNNKNHFFVKKLETESYAEFLFDKDIFISSSSYEQFSISAIEAMTAGLVSIVTEETGMSRFIRSRENGFVIKFDDSKGLIEALKLLNSDRKLLNDISENSKKIYNELAWEKVFDKYKRLYK